jgi:mannose-1-phosphate guanylyltransferase
MIAEIYAEINSISVDYAVLEKAKNVYVKKTDFAWSDLGTWNSLYEIAAKDNNLNVITGTKVAKIFNSDGNYLKTTIDKTLCIRDLNNFIVIDTEDVLVICKRENENEIKKFLEE